jgi:hypothetical protein
LYVTGAIVDHTGVDVQGGAWQRARQGRPVHSKYGIGQSFLAIPLYVAGYALAERRGNHALVDGRIANATELTYAATTMGEVATSASVAVLFLICVALGFTPWASALRALALGLLTFAWHYARTFMTEPTSMLTFVL